MFELAFSERNPLWIYDSSLQWQNLNFWTDFGSETKFHYNLMVDLPAKFPLANSKI